MRTTRGTLAVIAAASLLALAMTVAAQAAPRGGGGDAAGSRICSKLQAKLGDAFSTRFASMDDCRAQLASVAQAALAACAGEVRPSRAFRRCVQAGIQASLRSISGRGAGAGAMGAAGRLAARHCARIQAKRPAAGPGARARCLGRLAAAVKVAAAGCAGVAEPRTPEFKACVQAALKAAAANRRA